ncbi:MAG: hypothetical protein ACXVCE_02720, partial [Bacteriovorax sp.]
MKSFLMVLFMQINVLVFAAEVGAGEALLKCHDQKWPPQEIQSLMAKASSVIDEISQCKDDHNLKGEYLRKLDPPNKGWPQSLEDNPMLCLEALFDGLKGGAEDLMETIWDLAGAFSKVIDANFQGTYDFLKAAFTGNLSYWFAEASQNASDFLNKFLTSIKAIPDAVADSLKEKSEDWECRNDRGQVEMACRISGYLGADALAAVMTMGWNKLALVKKVSKLTKKILPNEKKKEKGFQKKEEKKDWSKAGLLGELIPLEKRSSRFVVEVDTKGHYSVRFFDESGAPKVFDGSPFYHLINKRHREAGEGTHRLKDRKTTNAGEHFTVDVAPEKFRQFLDYIEQKKGTISIACTRT